MKIEAKKITTVELLHEANSATTGKPSKMSLRQCYRAMHSNMRTQLFWVKCTDIPLFVASQFVRSHIGVQFFQRSKRTDRGGEDFNDVCRNIAFNVNTTWITKDAPEKIDTAQVADNLSELAKEIEQLPERFDRYAPTDLAFIINAEAIINMSRKRLCTKASTDTRVIWEGIIAEIAKVDPDLALFCVKPCVFSGGICREPQCCGFNKTELFQKALERYKKLFV